MSQLSPYFAVNRQKALAQWREFLPQTPKYGEQRNFVNPGHSQVSRLSPAIRCRLMLEDEIVSETLAAYPLAKVEKWVQEVCWRRYWKGWLECRPGVWTDYLERLQNAKHSEATLQRARDVAAGQSGVAVMDRFARELVETGYLHNHARMWFASFWIHVERLPWELGAEFFFQHLLDGDAASNTCSWRWVAGLQTAGKTYLIRRSNLDKYCGPEYLADETGLERLNDDVVTSVETEETADLKPAKAAVWPTNLPKFSSPTGLWIHDEDLSAEISGVLAGMDFAGIFRSTPITVGVEQAKYRQAAMGVPTENLTNLVEWAVSEGLSNVVAYAPFIGPLNDKVESLREDLMKENVGLNLIRRESDTRIFPMAWKGFFPFWEAMRKKL